MRGFCGLTERIIGCALRVAMPWAVGLFERSWNALAQEMRKAGLPVVQQQGIVVFCDDVIFGEYVADLIVEDRR
jgi:GxxExxY protein